MKSVSEKFVDSNIVSFEGKANKSSLISSDAIDIRDRWWLTMHNLPQIYFMTPPASIQTNLIYVNRGGLGVNYISPSLSADVLWGSFVTHSFLPVGEKWMRDERTPKDVCGEAIFHLV